MSRNSLKSVDERYRYWRRRIFAIAWVTYASFYLTRANMSVAIPGIMGELGFSKTAVGAVGSALLATYAVGQVVNGQLGDRFGARKLVTTGIVVSALANIAFGFSSTFWVMMALWAVNGYFQSMGWSPNIKTLANWFPLKQRGLVTGLYGSCYQVGNAVSWLLAGYVAAWYGWRYVFWVPAMMFGVFAVIYYAGIRGSPESVGLPSKSDEKPLAEERPGLRFTLKSTFENPRICIVGIALLFLNVVRYGFFVWVPTFLFEVQKVTISTATLKALMMPLAGSLGAALTGWATQKYFGSRRAPLVAVMLSFLGMAVWFFPRIPVGNWVLSLICLAIVGFFTYGPHVMMVTTMPMDLGAREGAVSSTTGFIDGFGYIGAALTGFGSGLLIDFYGWHAAFYLWEIAAIVAAVLMATLWKYKTFQRQITTNVSVCVKSAC